jgi:pentatricopeptide repeat protein
LMQAYGEAGGGDQAVACLDDMVAEGLQPNVISYAAAMSACRSNPSIVLKLLDRMKNEGVVPNTVVLTTAINALARGGTDTYTQIAMDMLADMEQVGPEPNIFTYNTITRAFAEAGRLEEAMAVLLSIRDRGLAPDRFTFTTLLMACGRFGNSISASTSSSSMNNGIQVRNIIKLMREAGVEPDEIAYGAAIDAYRRNGLALEAVECLQDMVEVGLSPSAAHYNLVLRSLKAAGRSEAMFKMVTVLCSKEEPKINANSLELTVEALLDKELWKEALMVVSSMEEMSFQMSLDLCVRLVEVLERNRQYKAVLGLYKKMVRSGYDFYENDILNEVFKRLIQVAATGSGADLNSPKTIINPITNAIKTDDVITDIENEQEENIQNINQKEKAKGNIETMNMKVIMAIESDSDADIDNGNDSGDKEPVFDMNIPKVVSAATDITT